MSAAATAAASDDAEPGADASSDESQAVEPDDASDAEGPTDTDQAAEPEEPAASSGQSHQPKTGVDINEGGSLFDL